MRAAPRPASCPFRDAAGEPIDVAWRCSSPAHSFTGEHVLELHGHGGPVVVELLCGACVELGARRGAAG